MHPIHWSYCIYLQTTLKEGYMKRVDEYTIAKICYLHMLLYITVRFRSSLVSPTLTLITLKLLTHIINVNNIDRST